MSRPQVGIDRLPVRRMSNEPKEAMNCKSCRKRKVRSTEERPIPAQRSTDIRLQIKCNRLRPACEACQVFACPCIYGQFAHCFLRLVVHGNSFASDAIPKKRGPKTDILESLLKRVDGLEKRLKTEASSDTSAPDSAPVPSSDIAAEVAAAAQQVRKASNSSKEPQSAVSQSSLSPVYPRSALSAQAPESALIIDSPTSPTIFPDVLLDTYFSRIHGKPYYILDEPSTRQRAASNQLPSHLAFSIYAISAR